VWPKFLSLEEENWPATKIGSRPEATGELRNKAKAIFKEPTSELEMPSRLQPCKFSSWSRLVRVRAWIQRYVNNCRRRIDERSPGSLSCREVADTENEIIKEAQ